jgi:methyl-accepting chemotaxis protein
MKMKWFYDLKIGMRLILALMFGGVLTAGVGYVGTVGMNKVAGLSSALYSNQTLGIAHLKQADISLMRMDRDQKNILLASTLEDREHYKSLMEEDDRLVSENLDMARPLIRTEAGKAMLAKDDQAVKEYREATGKIVSVAMREPLEKKRMSQEISDSLGREKVNAAEEAMGRSEAFKEGRAKQFAAEADQTFQSSRTLLIILTVWGLLGGLAAGFVIAGTVSRPLGLIAEAAKKLALGDTRQTIDYHAGDEVGSLADSFRTVIAAVNALTQDSLMLSEAAVRGALETRADATRHQGEFRKVIDGINQTLDAVVGPLQVSADYVEKIGKGIIPPKISESYNGYFNVIKNSLNACIDGLGGLSEADSVLQKMAVNDYRNAVEGKYQGVFASLAAAVNEVRARVSHVTSTVKNVSRGDLGELAEYRKVGRRSDGDEFVPSMILMMENIKALLDDVKLLGLASLDGKLSTRANAARHAGDFRKVIEGVNEMLDAILLPIGEGNRVLGLIRGGNLREKVEIVCKGDHEKMKDAVNGVHGWLTELITYVTKIANGDLSTSMAKASDQDQIHEWLILLKSNINALTIDATMLARSAAEGRLGTRADASQHHGDFRKIIEGVNQTLEAIVEPLKAAAENASSLASSSDQLTAVSQVMASTAEETAVQANVVSVASEQVSRNVASVATASQQIQASIREISKNANDSARVAKNAVTAAESTHETMRKLGESSQEIGNVIKVITSIAQQTNLLALNATIEAARAGEAGKGFAVVANEVKELAKQTARATEEISQKIEAIQGDTRGAVSAIEEIGAIITQINDISNSIASAVEEQTVTTNEIGRSVTEAAQGVTEIARSISGVAVSAKNTTRGANDTETASRGLSEMAARLQSSVARFAF